MLGSRGSLGCSSEEEGGGVIQRVGVGRSGAGNEYEKLEIFFQLVVNFEPIQLSIGQSLAASSPSIAGKYGEYAVLNVFAAAEKKPCQHRPSVGCVFGADSAQSGFLD